MARLYTGIRGGTVRLNQVQVAAVALARRLGQGSTVRLASCAGWIQLHREGRQAPARRRNSRVALVLTQFDQVLHVQCAAELRRQVLRVLGAAIERKKSVDVGED